jgi:NhaP-type Na+/H+ or K+/H+ antiporter
VESGLNDGICVPILLICFAINANLGTGSPIAQFGIFIKTIGIGVLVGACLAYLCNFLIKKAIDLKTSAESWTRVIVIALTIMILTMAELLGGSGFIACFTGGAVFGYLARRNKLKLEIAAEGVGEILSLATWVLFGSIVVAKFFSAMEAVMVLYALLSLTVIRMLPVSISLIRQKVNRESRMFIGWFGPRGLASIVFIVMALDQNLPHMDTIVMAAVGTILMSIVLHGVTANAIVNRYAQYLK